MLRNILAVIAGIVAGGIGVGVFEWLGHMAFPLQPALMAQLSDPETFREAAAQVPDINRLAVVAAWALGALVAGAVTAFVARRRHTGLALIAGGGLLFAGLSNLIMIPSPLWMWALGLAVFMPMAWLGARLVPHR
ncbi:hypothetical protein [Maricaulis sp.]|uniref:hypothetical protein n=1 Tax=Maricaulis sp. TaxID=1486257 RepID=UPI002602FC34|nr:hypothetical protein [Maricaulis sp.]